MIYKRFIIAICVLVASGVSAQSPEVTVLAPKVNRQKSTAKAPKPIWKDDEVANANGGSGNGSLTCPPGWKLSVYFRFIKHSGITEFSSCISSHVKTARKQLQEKVK